MKNILSAFAVIFFIVLVAATTAEDDFRVVTVNPNPDTLNTTASLDTITFTLLELGNSYNYELQISGDSLSGSTDATCHLEQNADDQGSDWVSLGSVTINGVTTRSRLTGNVLGGTLRGRCYAPSSTQSTAVRVDLLLDKK